MKYVIDTVELAKHIANLPREHQEKHVGAIVLARVFDDDNIGEAPWMEPLPINTKEGSHE